MPNNRKKIRTAVSELCRSWFAFEARKCRKMHKKTLKQQCLPLPLPFAFVPLVMARGLLMAEIVQYSCRVSFSNKPLKLKRAEPN